MELTIIKTKNCLTCFRKIDYRKIRCRNCDSIYRHQKASEITLGEFKKIHKSKYKSNLYDAIRKLLKYSLKGKIPSNCQNCKYDKHVEICHIKPISKFNENCKIQEINDLSNIMFLCPNCHWELDNSFLNSTS